MQTLKKKVFSIVEQAFDAVLPPRCVVTGDAVERQGMVSPSACVGLDFISEPHCAHCGFPFEFEVDEGAFCTPCLMHTPSFDCARSALKYNDISRDIILGFKHADKTHVVKAFVPWLKRAGDEIIECADYIVPVPLHSWRLIARRYNQSGLIADALGQDISKEVLCNGLLRVRATPSQGHLKAKERYKNVKHAFIVNKKHRTAMKGKNIVLIDDVYTTGATVKECTKVLKQAGVARVDVLTLARVVHGSEFF